MRLILGFLFVVLTGCSTTASQYYEAVQKTAEANAIASKAKFDALSQIASSGDGQAASAAVMALALTNTQSAQPLPQQSEAIQWASVLASPVTSLGMMWMQADSAKTMARYNSKTELARVAAESKDNQALYGAFVDTASAGYSALGNVDYTPFVDGMVTLGVTGMDNLVDLGEAGLTSNTAIATVGMNNLMTVGIEGMQSINETSKNWLTYSTARDGVWRDILATEQSGCVVTTDADNQVIVTCN